ncbi:hypothetical protein BamIOP4010DRAFT_6210 [Burkholderia ambifaria IOP40-10]|uniref:Uncharacterized protein n=1 Tax=Burkholderia ambifaria IOP40-10 TaxID=396596 RepID=B1FQ99_9BURK|nr:hypothetical protein BamIOP4010DRAFT_6210 [Burkholderia ambifaria IOP40-10]
MERGRRRALPVESMVLVETMVLGRDQRIDHVRRNLLERHPFAVRRLEFRQQLAVGGQHLRGLVDARLADVADAGRERNQRQHVQQEQHRHGGGREQHAAARRMTETAPGGGQHTLDGHGGSGRDGLGARDPFGTEITH